MAKHSILVVTYNQEQYIQSTLSSLLNQTEAPFEIVILDDCSTDNNWEIIKMNQEKYPDLIKAYRNENNLGLFANVKKSKTLCAGNVVSYCPGDDLLEPNTVKCINDKIREEKLNGENERFIIITNSVHLYPDGQRTIWDNYIERHIPAIKTRLRYGLSYRGVGLSKALLDAVITEQDFLAKNKHVGYNADFFKGFDEILKADKLFYVNESGGVYRLNVGVTSNQDAKKWVGHQAAYSNIRDMYRNLFDKRDLLFIRFIIHADEFKINPSFVNWLKATYLYVVNIGNFSYNNPWIRNLHYLIPTGYINWLKFKVYPWYLRMRRR